MDCSDKSLCNVGTRASDDAVDMFVDESSDVVPDEVIEGFLDHFYQGNDTDKKVSSRDSTSTQPKTSLNEEDSIDQQICYATATLVSVLDQLTEQPMDDLLQASPVKEQPDIDLVLTVKPCSWLERNLWRITIASLCINVGTILYIAGKSNKVS